MAIDVFPIGKNGCPTLEEMRELYDLAKKCLFGGIGIYTYTTLNGQDLHYMLHLDIRGGQLVEWLCNGKDDYDFTQGAIDNFFKGESE